jgi:predicted TIM-barrel fold metal-dependent hydrolase
MIVDVHTHVWDSLEQLGPTAAERERARAARPWNRPNASIEAHDQATRVVDYAFILGFEAGNIEAHISAARVAAYVANEPAKFIGFAGIDPMVDGYDDRLDEALELGLKGVVVSPWTSGYNPTHSDAMDLFDRCSRKGLPVVVHPDGHMLPQTNMTFGQPMLLDEVARELPDLKLIVSQMGFPWVDQTLVLVRKHANVFADISDIATRPSSLLHYMASAYEFGVIDKLLLGSNFPYGTPEEVILTIYRLREMTRATNLPGLPMEALRSIVERDTLAVLGIEKPAAAVEARPAPEATVEEVVTVQSAAARGVRSASVDAKAGRK